MKKFYLTTTLPYVNAAPHMGHALEFVAADIIARYHRDIRGEEVFMNTGTDEHGQKVWKSAKDQGREIREYVDENSLKFKELLKDLGVMGDINFIRTTDENHIKAAQDFWKIVEKNGYIEKKSYKVKYCVGCELEKTDSELVDGVCPIHPNLKIEKLDEENYFFKFSSFQKKLLELYEKEDFVVPTSRLGEIRNFVSAGLHDFSISRLKEKFSWGVPVPGDSGQVMYVWFDALINYISALGWPDNKKKFEGFWGTAAAPNAIQIAGKDNLRQQAAMWQAMLMAAGLPVSKQIIIHGFITSGGIKMSKTVGNVIDPLGFIKKYGSEALRAWLAKDANTFEDSDLTPEKFEKSYNANLVNGLGNLTSRIIKMAAEADLALGEDEIESSIEGDADRSAYMGYLDAYEIQKAAELVWSRMAQADAYIDERAPFRVIKLDLKQGKFQIRELLRNLAVIAYFLIPILPQTSAKIMAAIKNPSRKPEPLFPRVLS